MGARRVRARSRRADDLDRRLGAHASGLADVAIRTLRRDELDRAAALATLHAEAQAAGMALGMLATSQSKLEEIYRATIGGLDDRDHVLLVGERDGEIVAMAQLVRARATNATHRAEVRRVAVAAGARGGGIGARMMRAIDDAARTRTITLLWLTTHARTAACAFYEEAGYTRLGVMPSYSARPDGSLADGAFFYRELS